MKTLSLFFLLLSFSVISQSTNFEVGTGSQFKLSMKEGGNAELSIYVSESSFTTLGVEYYFSTEGLLGLKMWQQFIFKLAANAPIQINAGYVKTADMPNPESLTAEYLKVNNGVEVNDFLFAKKEELTKFYIADEKIEVPAGAVQTQHYRKERNGQIVDFWISPMAMPIGLVKLVSQNKNNVNQNYKIELSSLLKKVKREIDPKRSQPLTEKGKSVLAKPIKN